jgi:hypothetical protein
VPHVAAVPEDLLRTSGGWRIVDAFWQLTGEGED